jgi:hypothetical protein
MRRSYFVPSHGAALTPVGNLKAVLRDGAVIFLFRLICFLVDVDQLAPPRESILKRSR